MIHQKAIYLLPKEMFLWYKQNSDYLIEHAVDADKRRYAFAEEAPRHFIDLDHYDTVDSLGVERMPVDWKDAVTKFSEDTLMAYGVLPWRIQQVLHYLSKSFESRDVNAILKNSVDLGHYLSDAHVPLHTTENYNGQLSNQKGIHALWESRIPEFLARDYDFILPKASYIPNPLEHTWTIIRESHAELAKTLAEEKKLTIEYEQNMEHKYSSVLKSNLLKNDYSKEFILNYNAKLEGMVEKRMQKAVINVANYWFTAWVNAGQPNLELLTTPLIETDSIQVKTDSLKTRPHE